MLRDGVWAEVDVNWLSSMEWSSVLGKEDVVEMETKLDSSRGRGRYLGCEHLLSRKCCHGTWRGDWRWMEEWRKGIGGDGHLATELGVREDNEMEEGLVDRRSG